MQRTVHVWRLYTSRFWQCLAIIYHILGVQICLMKCAYLHGILKLATFSSPVWFLTIRSWLCFFWSTLLICALLSLFPKPESCFSRIWCSFWLQAFLKKLQILSHYGKRRIGYTHFAKSAQATVSSSILYSYSVQAWMDMQCMSSHIAVMYHFYTFPAASPCRASSSVRHASSDKFFKGCWGLWWSHSLQYRYLTSSSSVTLRGFVPRGHPWTALIKAEHIWNPLRKCPGKYYLKSANVRRRTWSKGASQFLLHLTPREILSAVWSRGMQALQLQG